MWNCLIFYHWYLIPYSVSVSVSVSVSAIPDSRFHVLVLPFRHTGSLFDRSSRPYCGTDIKLREVGPSILKYCYQLNNLVSVLCFYSATDCIISDYLDNKTVNVRKDWKLLLEVKLPTSPHTRNDVFLCVVK